MHNPSEFYDDESAFSNFLVGTGRWYVDKYDGILRNVHIVSNMMGLTSDQELEEYKKKIAEEYYYYRQTPASQSFAGKIGESGILPMLLLSRLSPIAATSLRSNALTGAAFGLADSVTSASNDLSVQNAIIDSATGALVGVVGYGIAKAGVIGYNKFFKPAAESMIDSFNSLKFNKYFQEELANLGKKLLYKRVSPLTHTLNQTNGRYLKLLLEH